jgi:hypothetical protein
MIPQSDSSAVFWRRTKSGSAQLSHEFVRSFWQEGTMRREPTLKIVLVLVGLLFSARRLSEYAEWTPANHLRHSRFVALRDDKDPRKVTRERSI